MRQYLLPGFLLVLDILILCVSAFLACWVRFDAAQYIRYIPVLTMQLPFLVALHVFCYVLFKLYHRVWRYAGMAELFCIAASNACGMCLFFFWVVCTNVMIPRSFYFLCFLFAAGGIAISRFCLRYAIEHSLSDNTSRPKNPVLIIGAGDAGNIIARNIELRCANNMRVVGFIDDDPSKKNQIMRGVRVLGGCADIESIVVKYGVTDIIIAIPSLKGAALRNLVTQCVNTKCHVKIVPEFVTELSTEEFDSKKNVLRPIQIEDLLERDPIHLNMTCSGKYVTGKRVLVTGAGGSIGSELVRQIIALKPQKIMLLGRGENSIFEIQQELCAHYDPQLFTPKIMNITNRKGMHMVYEEFKPQVVFHAAAHKHVPLMEAQPREAIYNNIIGSWNVADLAGIYGVEKFVLISTDKAVNPTSVMGATKRVTEKIMQSLNKKYPNTCYAAVRFGNVLGSRGSVVPFFKKQIAAGGPVTVTDPEMKRYFMTIPEASQLVIQAGGIATGGEVFVLDMGKPVKIVDLAKNMIRLSGLEPDKDIKIVFTGLRPGEKLFEELMTAEEGTEATNKAKIHKAILRDEDPVFLRQEVSRFKESKTDDELIAILQELIPTYKPNHFSKQ